MSEVPLYGFGAFSSKLAWVPARSRMSERTSVAAYYALVLQRRAQFALQRTVRTDIHPGVELRANLKSISHRCHLEEVASVWELTKETI